MTISERPEDLEHDVREIRENMTEIVSELDRRRHDVLDWPSALKKHAGPLVVAALGILLVIAGTASLSVLRKRRRQRPLEKARRLRQALSRMVAHPELIAQPRPNLANRALGAAASAAAGSLAKTLVERVSNGSARA